MSLQAKASPLITPKTPYGPGIGSAPQELRAKGFGESATAFESLLQRVNTLDSAARNNESSVREILVTDAAGKVIGAIGQFIFKGVPVTNYFSEIHVGDPLGTGDPSQALFNANSDGSVTIGQNGWLDVLDPYDGDAAWIGTQFDALAVTGAIASPTTPLIRLTVTGHTLATGDIVRVLNVGGVPNATGIRTVTKINANTIDLQATVFVGTFTSGGTVDRLMHVTGAANNGGGLIRLTVTAHTYITGDQVNVVSVGGVPNATGQWIVTRISANTFDLIGSTFAGTYTSGGTCLRYFAGGLFQTIAVAGTTFSNAKLRALADGSLLINGAEIILDGSGGTIVLDPTTGSITITDAGGGDQIVLQSGNITLQRVDSGGAVLTAESASLIEPGRYTAYPVGLTSEALSEAIAINGYTNTTAFGPLLGLHQFRGAPGSESASSSGDTLGGLVAWGYDGTGESSYVAGMRMLASQNHTLTDHGAKIVFEVTANGATTPGTGMTLDQDKTLNVVGGYKINGTAGISPTRSFGSSLTVNSSAVGVFGIPGAGQVNGTVVTSVALNLTSNTFSAGLLTV